MDAITLGSATVGQLKELPEIVRLIAGAESRVTAKLLACAEVPKAVWVELFSTGKIAEVEGWEMEFSENAVTGKKVVGWFQELQRALSLSTTQADNKIFKVSEDFRGGTTVDSRVERGVASGGEGRIIHFGY